MATTPTDDTDRLFEALGRIPSGLFILTVRSGPRSTGMLASWVMQAGFDPPMVTVALADGRFVGDWVARSGRLVLNQVAEGDKALIRHFGRGFDPEDSAFEGLELGPAARGGQTLAGALGYLDLEVRGEVGGGTHRVFLAEVVGGSLLAGDEATPAVHLRKNGRRY